MASILSGDYSLFEVTKRVLTQTIVYVEGIRINGKFVELEDGRSACMSKSVDKSSYSVLDLTVV